MGLEDSQALNLDPQRSGRRYRGGCEILDGEEISVPNRIALLVIGKELSVKWPYC